MSKLDEIRAALTERQPPFPLDMVISHDELHDLIACIEAADALAEAADMYSGSLDGMPEQTIARFNAVCSAMRAYRRDRARLEGT
jgi:hypothetical protein